MKDEALEYPGSLLHPPSWMRQEDSRYTRAWLAAGELPPNKQLSESESSVSELIFIAVSLVNSFQVFGMYIKLLSG